MARPRTLDTETRRARILEAALDLLSQKGYHDVRLDDVARRADIAKGTLYLYFRDKIGRLLPPSYVFEGMRAMVAGKPAPPAELFGGVVFALGYVFLAAVFFAHTYRFAVRTGLIARYSAETVS